MSRPKIAPDIDERCYQTHVRLGKYTYLKIVQPIGWRGDIRKPRWGVRLENQAKVRARSLAFNLRISEERAESLLRERIAATICEICGNGHRGLVIDHNHITGDIRGFICKGCNGKLAWLENYKAEIELYRIRNTVN